MAPLGVAPDLRNNDSGNWDKKWATSEIVRFYYFVPPNNEIQMLAFSMAERQSGQSR
jgi:hypothetical protein